MTTDAGLKKDIHYLTKIIEKGFKEMKGRLDVANGRLSKHDVAILNLARDRDDTNKEVKRAHSRISSAKKKKKEENEKLYSFKMLLISALIGGIMSVIGTFIVAFIRSLL